MTIRLGDHLVIKRDGKILTPADEAYHEFEVVEEPQHLQVEGEVGYEIKVKLIA